MGSAVDLRFGSTSQLTQEGDAAAGDGRSFDTLGSGRVLVGLAESGRETTLAWRTVLGDEGVRDLAKVLELLQEQKLALRAEARAK